MKWVKCISPLVRWQIFSDVKWLSHRTCGSALGAPLSLPNLFHLQGDHFTTYHSTNIQTVKCKPVSPTIVHCRNYAKGKDKKKEKGKTKVVVDEQMLAEIIPVDDIKNQMQKAVDHLKQEYVQSLSIRSSAGSVENIRVSFEGKDYSIQELGQVVRKDTKTVIINMVAFPQAIPAVLKSLQKSGMNLNPQQDGTTLYIPVPKVTTEHRAQLAKNAKSLFIQCRDAVKSIQIKHEKKLKNNSSLAQDTVFSVQQQLQSLSDSYIAVADSLLQTKVKELTGP